MHLEFHEIEPEKKSQNDNASSSPTMQKPMTIRVLLLLDCPETQHALMQMTGPDKKVDMALSPDLSGCLSALNETRYDLVITDDGDGDLSAAEIISRIKGSQYNPTLILLTNVSCPKTEANFLGLGADYVMLKPVEAPLLLARIKAVMRWRHSNNGDTPKIGPFEFHLGTRSLVIPDSGNIKFTEKETRVLQYMLRRKGGIVSRADLLNFVWGYSNAVNTHTVETHIYRLRKKLSTVLDSKSVIVTETGGYRLAS